MSATSPLPTEQPKKRSEFNAFLFNIANQFTLEEFKKFTNFPEVLQRACNRKLCCAADKKTMDDLIQKNYKIRVPVEKNWRRGGFKDLKLTQDFYGSDVAIRIFKEIYGLKNCVVVVGNVMHTSRVDRHLPDSDEKRNMSSDENNVAVTIDLTIEQTNDNESVPKRKLKYPRKGQIPGRPSGVATYTSTRKFVDQTKLQSAAGLDIDSSAESAIEMVDPPTVIVPIAAKRVEVISNIVLVPPTPFRDETNQRRPGNTKDASLQSSQNKKSKPKIGPKSKVQQRPSKVVYIEEDSEDLLAQLLAINTTDETSQNFGLKQTEIRTLPRMKNAPVHSPANSTQGLLQDLLFTEPPPIEQEALPIIPIPKPRIASKCAMKVDQNTTVPPTANEHLQEPLPNMPIPKARTGLLDSSPNVAVPTTKPRIGPKSVMKNRRQLQLSTEELLENSMGTTIVFAQEKQRVEHNSRVKPIATTNELLHTCPLAAQTDDAHVPEEGVISTVNMSASSQREPLSKSLPVERIGISAVNDAPTHCTESSELRNHFMQALNDLMTRFPEHMRKYLTETDPSALSLRYFFCEFLKSEYEEDISAAETQLSNSITNSHDGQLEAQSQVVLRLDQLEAQNMDDTQMEVESSDADRLEAENVHEIQMKLDSTKVDPLEGGNVDDIQMQVELSNAEQLEVENVDNIQEALDSTNVDSLEVDQLEAENVDKIQMEPLPSQTDLHPDQCIVEHSDAEVRVKIEDGCEGDHNDTCSSDVQIVEVPPEAPIEILSDDTQELVDNLNVAESCTQEQLCVPFTIPQLPIVIPSKQKSTTASSSKRFVTSLPVVATKKRNYPALNIVVESAHKFSPTELPMHDFSQQPPTPPSNENYQIEECTMTESQYQRYELLNDENSLFLSSQLENYTGQAPDPKSAITTTTDSIPQPFALKRLSAEKLSLQPYKRRRFTTNETVKPELNWKVMDIKSIAFKPLANSNNTFHLELQLRRNFDTFHVQEQLSIKRMLHLTNNEWKIIARVLTTLNGYQYDCSTTAITRQKLNLPSRIIDCFVQSIPMFVRSNVHFKDFMGYCLEVSEQQPLQNKCIDAAIDPHTLMKMGELKKRLNETNK